MSRDERASRRRSPVRVVVLAAATVITTCPLVALTAVFGVAALRDWQIQAVLSSSMYPTIKRGSLTIVVPEPVANLEPGMPIAFRDPVKSERIVVHRVVNVTHYGNRILFRTKGDFNKSLDARPLPAENVIGRVRWTIPYIGGWLDALRTRIGALGLIGLPLVLVIFDVLVRRRRRGTAADVVPGILTEADLIFVGSTTSA